MEKNGTVLLMLFVPLLSFAQNGSVSHERIPNEQAGKILNDLPDKTLKIRGDIKLMEKCSDRSGDYYFIITLAKGRYTTNKRDSVYDKLSAYKFVQNGYQLNIEIEHHEQELPKFTSGIECIELSTRHCEFADINKDSLLDVIIVYTVAPEVEMAYSFKMKILVFSNDSLSTVQIEDSHQSKNMQVSPRFYSLPSTTQNHIVNKIALLNASNSLPKNWKKGIKRKKMLIK